MQRVQAIPAPPAPPVQPARQVLLVQRALPDSEIQARQVKWAQRAPPALPAQRAPPAQAILVLLGLQARLG